MEFDEFIKEYFGTIEACKIAIKQSHSLLAEGAWTNEGLYWVAPSGKTILVNTVDNKNKISHEEYANQKWNVSLEDALHKGYIRVQAISPQYLFVDHRQKRVRNAQVPGLTGFFFNEQMSKIPYQKFVVERANNDMMDFKQGQNNAALQFAISGETPQNAEAPISTPNVGASNYVRQMDYDNIPSAYKRPGVNPFGDSVDYSFANWIAEHKNR